MNLIFCNDDCEYQNNGSCTYDYNENQINFTNSTSNCLFYKAKINKNKQNNEFSSQEKS